MDEHSTTRATSALSSDEHWFSFPPMGHPQYSILDTRIYLRLYHSHERWLLDYWLSRYKCEIISTPMISLLFLGWYMNYGLDRWLQPLAINFFQYRYNIIFQAFQTKYYYNRFFFSFFFFVPKSWGIDFYTKNHQLEMRILLWPTLSVIPNRIYLILLGN